MNQKKYEYCVTVPNFPEHRTNLTAPQTSVLKMRKQRDNKCLPLDVYLGSFD